MPRIPVSFRAEYRGVAPGGEFERDGTTVAYTPGLKFEISLPDGDVESLMIRQGQLDQAADFDCAALKKGDEIDVDGVVRWSGDYAPKLVPLRVRRAGKQSSVAAA